MHGDKRIVEGAKVEKTEKFDQEAMDRVTDKVLAFKPKKPKRQGKKQGKDGAANPQSDAGR